MRAIELRRKNASLSVRQSAAPGSRRPPARRRVGEVAPRGRRARRAARISGVAARPRRGAARLTRGAPTRTSCGSGAPAAAAASTSSARWAPAAPPPPRSSRGASSTNTSAKPAGGSAASPTRPAWTRCARKPGSHACVRRSRPDRSSSRRGTGPLRDGDRARASPGDEACLVGAPPRTASATHIARTAPRALRPALAPAASGRSGASRKARHGVAPAGLTAAARRAAASAAWEGVERGGVDGGEVMERRRRPRAAARARSDPRSRRLRCAWWRLWRRWRRCRRRRRLRRRVARIVASVCVVRHLRVVGGVARWRGGERGCVV